MPREVSPPFDLIVRAPRPARDIFLQVLAIVVKTFGVFANKRSPEQTIAYIEDNVPMFEQWLDSLVEQAARELTSEQLEQCRGQNWFGHVPAEKMSTDLDEADRMRRERMDEEMIPVFGDLAIGAAVTN